MEQAPLLKFSKNIFHFSHFNPFLSLFHWYFQFLSDLRPVQTKVSNQKSDKKGLKLGTVLENQNQSVGGKTLCPKCQEQRTTKLRSKTREDVETTCALLHLAPAMSVLLSRFFNGQVQTFWQTMGTF